jgi:pimeloyl-ACP methyl ester carboxylesterase
VTCLREKTILSATEDEVFGLSQMLQEDRPRGNDDDAMCLSLSRKNTCMAPLPDLDLNKDCTATESNSQQGSDENRGTAVLEGNEGRQNSSLLSPKNRISISPNAQVKKMKRPRQISMSHHETSRHVIRQEIQMKKFAPDDKTEIPYCILSSTLSQPRQKANSQSGPNSRKAHTRPKCNLVVCHDLFDTFERMQIYLAPFIERFAGHKILLWNYAGQAYTKFSDTECLNNAFHTKCLIKLIDHVGIDGTNEFATNEPFYIMGHGQGGSIACLYAKSRQQPSLKGLFLVNPLSYVDTHFASVIHDCRNVFNCSPEERPDLPLYFYSRFLFSDGYLKKTPTALALNLYAAVHNPITLRGRIRLCDGALDNVDLRGIVNEVFAPIISLHGKDASLMRPLHAATFLQDRECCSTIQQAVYRKGGKRTVVVMTEGGHELFQEKKKTICMLIEQLLTGNVSSPQNVKDVNTSTADNNRGKQDNLEINDNTNQQKWSDLINFSQKTKDDSSDPSKPPARHFRDETNVKHRDNGNRKIRSLEEHCINRPTNMLLDPENPTFERQKNSIYKPSAGSSIYPALDEDRKTKEYMAWRLRRNRKRLTRFQRAAGIIQKTLRAFMAKTMIARLKRQTSALTIQRCYRGMLARFIFIEKRKEIWASRFVQRMYRGRIGRKTSYFTRITKKSQIHIAKMWRGYVARKWVNRLLLRRNSAATDFQTLWRGCMALKLAGIMRLRRNSCIVIQRIHRGRRGRQKADKEREKYLFSRSQSRGIEIGRQMLSQHKSQATKLQSELSILSQEKKILEEKVKFITQEITNFQETLTTLEKSMQEICLIEVDLKSSKFDSSRAKADISIRQKKS